ncbi:MAG TPA: hypothetical protein VLD16_05625 [Gaiellaceae bacterium]|nr:hypothetical protein [Gaiellaceae bacterium]
MPRLPYVDGLATTLAGAAVPYGYAIAIWSTGALLMNRHSTPHVVDVVLFAGGAAAAYAVLRIGSRNGESHQPQGIGEHNVLRGGVVHLVAISAAIVAAGLLARLPAPGAWVAAPLAATLLYLGGTALTEAREIALSAREALRS